MFLLSKTFLTQSKIYNQSGGVSTNKEGHWSLLGLCNEFHFVNREVRVREVTSLTLRLFVYTDPTTHISSSSTVTSSRSVQISAIWILIEYPNSLLLEGLELARLLWGFLLRKQLFIFSWKRKNVLMEIPLFSQAFLVLKLTSLESCLLLIH